MSFLPLYEIQTKYMRRLDTRYQLKNKSIEIKFKLKLSINKICALRYMNIVGTNKANMYEKKFDTN